MENVKRVYWKRRPDASPNAAISGWCGADEVPPEGEVKCEPLPTDVEIIENESGTLTVHSPPFLGTTYAYRYVMHINDHWRQKIAAAQDNDLDLIIGSYGPFSVQRAPSRERDTSLENWWWYSKDDFRMVPYDTPAPLRLIKKWKSALIEIMLDGHPQKEQKLAEWQSRIDGHKQSLARNRKQGSKPPKKSVGDLVLKPRPQSFKTGTIKQIFIFSEVGQNKTRKTLGLKINGTRYKVPHGDCTPITNATLADSDVSLPVRIAANLLLWERSPMSTAHEIISASSQYRAKHLTLMAEFDEEFSDFGERDLTTWETSKVLHNLSAAKSALQDLCGMHKVKDNALSTSTHAEIQGFECAVVKKISTFLAQIEKANQDQTIDA